MLAGGKKGSRADRSGIVSGGIYKARYECRRLLPLLPQRCAL
jgi:hypothetical protein